MIVTKRKYQALETERDQLQEEINRLNGGDFPEEIRPKLEDKATITFDGHSYFQFADMMDIPWSRMDRFHALSLYSRCGVDPELLAAYYDAIQEDYNEGKSLDVGAKLAKLRDRFTLAPDPDHLYKLGCIFFIRDDEDPMKYTEAMTTKKVAHIKKNPQARRFFLTVSLHSLIGSGPSVKDAIETYLGETLKMWEELKATF